MKTEDIKELRKLGPEKLEEKAEEVRRKSAEVDFKLRTGVNKDTSEPKRLQKYLARIETVKTEKLKEEFSKETVKKD